MDSSLAKMVLPQCESCDKETIYSCPFCLIYERQKIAVCDKGICREKHEAKYCARVLQSATKKVEASL